MKYEVMGLGDKPYTHREVAEMVADCIIGAVNRIRPEGATDWQTLRDTEFGTMLPQVNARWALEEAIIKRRYPWYFHTLMAFVALSLLSYGWSHLIEVAEMDEEFLSYYFYPMILAGVAGAFNVFCLLSLLYHYWQLIPRQLNKLPPAVRVIPLLAPFLGAIWSFWGFYALAVKLKEVHLHSGLRREKDCVGYAMVGCICYCLSFTGIFLLPLGVGICAYLSINCMQDQALDILNKRLRINFDTGIVTASTPIAPGLRKFVRPYRSHWIWIILIAVLCTWSLPALAGLGLYHMIARQTTKKAEIFASTLSEEERVRLGAACDRLEAALKAADPENRIVLTPDATDAQIDGLRKSFGNLRVEALEFYLRRFNGTRYNIMPAGRLFTCDEMAAMQSCAFPLHPWLPDAMKRSVTLAGGGEGGRFMLMLTPEPLVRFERWMVQDEEVESVVGYLSLTEFVNLMAQGIEEKIWTPGEAVKPGEAYYKLLEKYVPETEAETEEEKAPGSVLEMIRKYF